jgi:hypothetical protein
MEEEANAADEELNRDEDAYCRDSLRFTGNQWQFPPGESGDDDDEDGGAQHISQDS